MTQVKTIDISNYQGKVSSGTFMKNRESIPYVILKVSGTWGEDKFGLYPDAAFPTDVVNAYKGGMKIGGYHFSQATSETEAIKEAEYCIKQLEPYKSYITLPVFCDWEFFRRLNSHNAGKMGKQRCGQIVDAFCRTMQKAGYKTGVYANLSTLTAFLPSDLYQRWPIWVAQYAKRCDYKHAHIMWQYSSSGKVSGIPGRIDMNWWYGYIPEPVPVHGYAGPFPVLPKRGWFSSGDRGEQVKRLQRFLNWYGGYDLVVDGEVGRKTINAVKQYQGREKLKVDGAFGKNSLERAKVVRR